MSADPHAVFRSNFSPLPSRASARRQSAFAQRLLRACCAIALCGVLPAASVAQSSAASGQNQNDKKPNTPVQVIPPVTTTVEVHGQIKDNYLPGVVTVGTLDGAPLTETPLSATVVTRELLDDQAARLLSDVVKNDASVGEDYAPVGYYGDFEIRGIPIDLATGLEINGMTIAGEQDVPLENKERVEILKGIAGVESGVAAAGGLIDYVTKRPATLKAADMATDHRGTAFGAGDIGRFFGSRSQVGARVNLAGEHIMSYVDDADGWRAMGAGSVDWKLSPKAILKGDFEYQHKVERSVCGYQLLGGTVVPDINRIYPSTMLGEQSWALPNTFDAHNSSARFDYELPRGWKVFAAASYSHSLIDDNVVYAYGNSVAGPDYFFAPDGSYDVYDYRNPGELRIDAQSEAMALGRVKTGALTHDVAAGVELFRRSVQQPSSSVYDWVGSENIYQPIVPFPMEINPDTGKPDQAGPRVLDEDDHQTSILMQDRIHVPGRVQLIVGGREDQLRDHDFDAADTNGVSPVITQKWIWLPQYAATFNPVGSLTFYGNYGVMLSLGPQAPWWTDNSSAYLSPYFTRQAEVGAKFQPQQRILMTAALYRMRTPFFYPKLIDAPDSFCATNLVTGGDVEPNDQCFEQEGRETHDGVELNAEGKAAGWLRLSASAAAIRAISDNTGTPAFDSKQVLNVPHLHTSVFADVALPHARGLHLMPGWSYTGRKEATRDDAVSVPGYNLFNLGASYTPGGEQGRMTLRLYADNIGDKRYWKDTGANYGDTFIHLGAPTTVRLSAHYTF